MSPVYQRKDHYYRKAKEEGLASRAAYKLEEMDLRFHLLKPGIRVFEMGCAPGGWLQWIAKKIGPTGLVVGVDRLPLSIPLPPRALFVLGDATESSIQEKCIRLLEGPADLVLSDLSPN